MMLYDFTIASAIHYIYCSSSFVLNISLQPNHTISENHAISKTPR